MFDKFNVDTICTYEMQAVVVYLLVLWKSLRHMYPYTTTFFTFLSLNILHTTSPVSLPF